MELVAKITIEQKDSLIGQLVQPSLYFNPVQDCDGNWIISEQEINDSIYPEHIWVKDLPKIEWCAPQLKDLP